MNGGELFNGMMMPFSQMAVAGALWYRKIATPPSRLDRSLANLNASPSRCLKSLSASLKCVTVAEGENNLCECFGPSRSLGNGREPPGGGPRACGVHNESTGYACKMQALVGTQHCLLSAVRSQVPKSTRNSYEHLRVL